MTLLSALRATKVLGLAVVLVAGGMTTADARDERNPHHRHHHGHAKWLPGLERPGHGGRLGTVFHSGEEERQGWRGDGFGTFTAYRLRGDSISIYIEGAGVTGWRGWREIFRRSEPKVITITPGQNDCSWEAGVCVIRPSW